MLFGKLTAQRNPAKVNIIIFSGILTLLFIFSLSACTITKGSIVILEDGHGTGFTMNLKDYNLNNKCELSLAGGDVVQVEVERRGGKIGFTINGKNGSEPYVGNNLKSGVFTVTVSETDEYEFRISGRGATGRIAVKNLGKKQ